MSMRRERDRQRERQTETDRQRQRERGRDTERDRHKFNERGILAGSGRGVGQRDGELELKLENFILRGSYFRFSQNQQLVLTKLLMSTGR